MRSLLLYFLLLTLLFVPLKTHGQLDSVSTIFVDSLLIQEVVVASSRINNNFFQALKPIQKSSFSPIPQLNQIINQVGGIEMQIGALNTNRINIRGIGSRSPFATSKLKAYLDDIPLTDGAGETSLEDLNLNTIEEIRIIKGPNSSLYGATLGGTMVLNSLNPLDQELKSNLSINQGSYGLWRGNSNLHKNWNDRHFSFLNIEGIKSEGYRENNNYEKSSGTLIHKIVGKDSYWTFFVNFIKLKAEIPSSLSINDYQDNPRLAAANWAAVSGYEDYTKTRLGISYNKKLSANSNFIATTFGNYFNAFEFRPFNVLDDDSYLYGIRTRYLFEGEKLNFTIGIESSSDSYNWEIFENISDKIGSLLQRNKSIRNQHQAFGEINYDIVPNLKIFGGIHLNRANFNIDYKLTSLLTDKYYEWNVLPRFGLQYSLKEGNVLAIQWSKGLIYPGLDESLDADGIFNEDLIPETGGNTEISWRWKIAERLEIKQNLYWMRVDNILVNRQDQNGLSFSLNAGKTRHLGWEPEMNIDILATDNNTLSLGFRGGFGEFTFVDFLENDDFSGNKLTGVSGTKWDATLLWNRENFTLRSQIRYVGQIPVNDENTIFSESYYVQRIMLDKMLQTGNNQLSFSLSIDNFWNVKYSSMIAVNPSSFGGNSPRIYYPGLPRNYTLGLTYAL
jgi:iron complex outermembrane receptor protein